MKSIRRLIFLILPPLAALLLGCGSTVSTKTYSYLPSASFPDSVNDYSFAQLADIRGDFVCPNTANVVPNFDLEMDGSGYYKVCYHKTLSDTLFIVGDVSQSEKEKQVYVFPIQFVDKYTIWLKPDVNKKSVAFEQAQVNDDGFEVKFNLTDFNSVIIVESQYIDKMRACLLTKPKPSFNLCPPFSFGKFKK